MKSSEEIKLKKYKCEACGKTLYFFKIESGIVEIKCNRRGCGHINRLDKRSDTA